jgi:hypothetical protein
MENTPSMDQPLWAMAATDQRTGVIPMAALAS